MKIITWNVNGIRAAGRAGFLDWFAAQGADAVCVQETKATPDQLDLFLRNPHGANSFWHSAQKAGYSGVATFTKRDPLAITEGIGVADIDEQGRVLVTEFPEFVIINAYFPNSQRDHARLPYKLKFCATMLTFCEKYRSKGKHVILCGDFNIAHKPIDLKNPKTNEKNAGYLPEERAWLDQFVAAGYVDAFRRDNPEPGHYTWWSYRPGVREKNIGWRLDYHFVNQEFADRIKRVEIQCQVKGSDHCPVMLEIRK